ncbi:MAG: DNA polymerase III subunit chi [Pseudomonadota bacterium]
MADIWFYHFERGRLEDLLPPILTRCLGREWRVVVRASSPERVAALDDHLWTFDERAFLPHGADGDAHADRQPVWITAGAEAPNAAQAQILVDAAEAPDYAPFERSMLVFDGRDDAALTSAREAWKAAKEAGHTLSYWQLNPTGRWEKKAQHPPEDAE